MTDVVVTFESVPQVAPEQPLPDSAQVTPLFCVSFCSVTVNVCLPMPVWMLGLVGAKLTPIPGVAVTVIEALDTFVASAIEVAVSVIAAGEGTIAGAV